MLRWGVSVCIRAVQIRPLVVTTQLGNVLRYMCLPMSSKYLMPLETSRSNMALHCR